MKPKYLSKEELLDFIAYTKDNKVTQRKVAEICGLHEQWISKVFRNANSDEPVKFERARARLLLMEKKQDPLDAITKINEVLS